MKIKTMDEEKLRRLQTYAPTVLSPVPLAILTAETVRSIQVIEDFKISANEYGKFRKKLKNPLYRFWMWFRNKIKR